MTEEMWNHWLTCSLLPKQCGRCQSVARVQRKARRRCPIQLVIDVGA